MERKQQNAAATKTPTASKAELFLAPFQRRVLTILPKIGAVGQKIPVKEVHHFSFDSQARE